MPVTNCPTIRNAPLPAEGSGTFSNYVLVAIVTVVPFFLTRFVPYFSFSTAFVFLFLLTSLPLTVGYWMVSSIYGGRKNDKCNLPGKNIEEYLEIKDPELRAKYNGQTKIPMQVFHDAYFDGKIEVKGQFFAFTTTSIF